MKDLAAFQQTELTSPRVRSTPQTYPAGEPGDRCRSFGVQVSCNVVGAPTAASNAEKRLQARVEKRVLGRPT
jgi:hypothetical protein